MFCLRKKGRSVKRKIEQLRHHVKQTEDEINNITYAYCNDDNLVLSIRKDYYKYRDFDSYFREITNHSRHSIYFTEKDQEVLKLFVVLSDRRMPDGKIVGLFDKTCIDASIELFKRHN